MAIASAVRNAAHLSATTVRHAVKSRGEPFRSAEEAWFWTFAALMARRDGARSTANMGKIARPCDPDDVLKCLDQLYRRRRIELVHARILRIWGERQMQPRLQLLLVGCVLRRKPEDIVRARRF